jgi:excisionase family DNA binding protein
MELLISPVEAAKRLGIGRTQMFDLIGRGEVKSVKIGRLRRVPVTALSEYVDRLTATAN